MGLLFLMMILACLCAKWIKDKADTHRSNKEWDEIIKKNQEEERE
jgi:hypothetical protein